jgi:hypothetical protein
MTDDGAVIGRRPIPKDDRHSQVNGTCWRRRGPLGKHSSSERVRRAVDVAPCRGMNRDFVKTRVAEMFRRKTL